MIDGDFCSDVLFLLNLALAMRRNPLVFDAIDSLVIRMETDVDVLVDQKPSLLLKLVIPELRLDVDYQTPSARTHRGCRDASVIIWAEVVLPVQVI